MLINNKIQNFFSQQLQELKDNYKKGGKVYIAPTKELAIERCLELADFDVCVEDIKQTIIICNCNKDVFGYMCVNPSTLFYFVVSVCDCKK